MRLSLLITLILFCSCPLLYNCKKLASKVTIDGYLYRGCSGQPIANQPISLVAEGSKGYSESGITNSSGYFKIKMLPSGDGVDAWNIYVEDNIINLCHPSCSDQSIVKYVLNGKDSAKIILSLQTDSIYQAKDTINWYCFSLESTYSFQGKIAGPFINSKIILTPTYYKGVASDKLNMETSLYVTCRLKTKSFSKKIDYNYCSKDTINATIQLY